MSVAFTVDEKLSALEGRDLEVELAQFDWRTGRHSPAQAFDSTEKNATPKIRPDLQKIAQADIRDLSSVMQQLVNLRKSVVEDHRGKIRPTDHAFELAVGLLVDASVILRQARQAKIPRASVSPDFEGGLRIEWFRPQGNVHLVIPNCDGGECYIYHEQGTDFGVDDDVTAERLASWLQIIQD